MWQLTGAHSGYYIHTYMDQGHDWRILKTIVVCSLPLLLLCLIK
jgi:hypothetical protein